MRKKSHRGVSNQLEREATDSFFRRGVDFLAAPASVCSQHLEGEKWPKCSQDAEI